MASIILSTICAAFLGTATLPANADTTNVYIIDNVQIKNFSGIQLTGKTILAYDISIDTERAVPARVHIIKTAPSGSIIRYEPEVSGRPIEEFLPIPLERLNNPVFFLDGESISESAFKSLDTRTIAGVKAMNDAAAADYLQSLKDEGKYDGAVEGRGVVIVTSKEKKD